MSLPARQNLYRKYRPQTFADLSGQKHIVKTLQAAVATGRISHAYMFSGPRGTGKTSAARLLAKILNCVAPVKIDEGLLDACGKCDNCQRIEELNFMDIIEIDAASNNGVEDIRQMREKVKYKPVEGKYKVYIIDEVHMLSGSAFNAFLKTLEEPPENILFILATTDPQKVPATIISRCQCFDFHSVSSVVIKKRLEEIIKMEKESGDGSFPDFESEALSAIAESAQGGFRDALSLLDQISSSSTGEKIETEFVLEMTRRLGHSAMFRIAQSVFKNELANLIKDLGNLFSKGYEPGTIGKDLLEYFRRCMVLKIDPKIDRVLTIPDEQVADILQQIQSVKLEHLIHSVTRLESVLMRLKSSFHSKILLETELVKLAQGEKFFEVEALEKRICELEVKISQLARKGNRPAATKHVSPRISSFAEEAPPPAFIPEEVPSNDPFSRFKNALGSRSKICSALLVSAKMVGIEDGCLKLALSQDFAVKRLKEEKNYALLLAVAKEVFGEINSVVVVNPTNEKKNSLNDSPKRIVSHQEEIARIDEEVRQKLLAKPSIADAVEVFGGEIVKIDK